DARGQRDRQRERAGAGLHVAAAFGDRTFPLNVRVSFKRRHKAPFENGSGFWVLGSGLWFWFWVLGPRFWVLVLVLGSGFKVRLKADTTYIVCDCVHHLRLRPVMPSCTPRP